MSRVVVRRPRVRCPSCARDVAVYPRWETGGGGVRASQRWGRIGRHGDLSVGGRTLPCAGEGLFVELAATHPAGAVAR